MSRLLLLINPASRSGADYYEEIHKKLESRGCTILNTKDELKKSSFTDLVLAYADHIDVVVVGGGDGSVNEVLDIMVKIQKPILLIPLGTANNLARTLKIPRDLDKNLDLVRASKIQKIDLGVVNEKYFVNVAGIGLSARVNQAAKSELKKKLGVFAFILTAFIKAKSMKPFTVEIKCDQITHIARSWQVSICNGKHYGSGLVIAEDATLKDGLLHCLSTEVKQWWHGFFLIPSVIKGKYGPNEDTTLLSGQEIYIQTKKPMKIDLDGDIKCETPARIRIEKEVLPILVSN